MKTLVAVRIKATGQAQMFGFKSKKNALSFMNSLKKEYGGLVDVARTIGKLKDEYKNAY